MSFLLRLALTAALLLALFEGMVVAFNWMNLPSNAAVFGGMAALFLLALAALVAFRFIWFSRRLR